MAAKLELLAELSGHTDRAWAVAWSPDGTQLASCSGDRTVRIWARDPASGWCCTSILEDGQTRTIRSCAWSPSGRYLATASFDATTAIWERDGSSWEQVATLEGHENEVKCVSWSPDGSLIATCGRDKSVWIWESIPGNEYECVDVKQGHSQDVKCVAWHPSGEVLASASYDDTIRLWTSDGDEWTCAQTLGGASGVGHSSTVWAIAFEPSGGHMVSCSDDCTLRVWACQHIGTAATGGGASTGSSAGCAPPWRLLCTLSGYHSRTVYSCDWGPAGLLAAGDGDNQIKVYGRTELDGEADAASISGSVSPEERPYLRWQLLAAAQEAHDQDVNCVRWHPTDLSLLASAGDDGVVRLWRCAVPDAISMQLG